MAVREFTDSTGREWRAWDVMPDNLSPGTKEEAYLAQLYITGWIVFETKSGDEKRRFYPVPKAWAALSAADLEILLQKAEVIPRRKLREEQQAQGEAAAQAMDRTTNIVEHAADAPADAARLAREETPDVTDLSVVRSFRYPGGRLWTVCIIPRPEDGGPPVLRFSAGARNIDLRRWPKEWPDYPDEELVRLLRLASPRAPGPPAGPDTPRRRYTDFAATADERGAPS